MGVLEFLFIISWDTVPVLSLLCQSWSSSQWRSRSQHCQWRVGGLEVFPNLFCHSETVLGPQCWHTWVGTQCRCWACTTTQSRAQQRRSCSQHCSGAWKVRTSTMLNSRRMFPNSQCQSESVPKGWVLPPCPLAASSPLSSAWTTSCCCQAAALWC